LDFKNENFAFFNLKKCWFRWGKFELEIRNFVLKMRYKDFMGVKMEKSRFKNVNGRSFVFL
jgi:hypothetical protein